MKHNNQTSIIHEQFNLLVDKILSSEPDYQNFFNTKDLPDHFDFDNEKAPNRVPEMRYFFKELDKIKSHVLYYFELNDVQSTLQLKKLLDGYRRPVKERGTDYRVVPATNSYDSAESKVLYLGVRRGGGNKSGLTNIVGRINQHLGYYQNGKTQGLQLYHYARGKDFEITLKVYEFPNLDKNYLNVIEKIR